MTDEQKEKMAAGRAAARAKRDFDVVMAAVPEMIDMASPPADAPIPEATPAVEGVEVMLLCDHVYLPENPLAENWETSDTTRKYSGTTPAGKRTRLQVHPTLADFLQTRKQAEIL